MWSILPYQLVGESGSQVCMLLRDKLETCGRTWHSVQVHDFHKARTDSAGTILKPHHLCKNPGCYLFFSQVGSERTARMRMTSSSGVSVPPRATRVAASSSPLFPRESPGSSRPQAPTSVYTSRRELQGSTPSRSILTTPTWES